MPISWPLCNRFVVLYVWLVLSFLRLLLSCFMPLLLLSTPTMIFRFLHAPPLAPSLPHHHYHHPFLPYFHHPLIHPPYLSNFSLCLSKKRGIELHHFSISPYLLGADSFVQILYRLLTLPLLLRLRLFLASTPPSSLYLQLSISKVLYLINSHPFRS